MISVIWKLYGALPEGQVAQEEEDTMRVMSGQFIRKVYPGRGRLLSCWFQFHLGQRVSVTIHFLSWYPLNSPV